MFWWHFQSTSKEVFEQLSPLVNVLCLLTQVTFAEIFRSTLYMLTYSRFFRVYDNQQVRPEVSKMAENSKRSICDPKTTRLLKFFKYRNIESTEIILNGFPRKDRGYLIEGNKYQRHCMYSRVQKRKITFLDLKWQFSGGQD